MKKNLHVKIKNKILSKKGYLKIKRSIRTSQQQKKRDTSTTTNEYNTKYDRTSRREAD